MSKFNLNPKDELANFETALGDLFPKICNDCKSFIGRLENNNDGKDVIHTLSACKVSAKFMLESKEGHKVQLPPNAPMSILLRFGTQLTALDYAMGTRKWDKEHSIVSATGFQSAIPQVCVEWVNQQRIEMKEASKLVPAAK